MKSNLAALCEVVITTILSLVLLILSACGLFSLIRYVESGGLGESCYSDQTCEGNLVCTRCGQGCDVTFKCVPR